MKTEFRSAPHDVIPNASVIEMWYDGRLIGVLYGADGPGVRIISKHIHPDTVQIRVAPGGCDFVTGQDYPGAAEILLRSAKAAE